MEKNEVIVPEIDTKMVAPVLRPAITEITTKEDADAVSAFNSACALKIKNIQEFFAESKEMAHKTHKAICTKEKLLCQMFEEGKSWANDTLTAWAVKERNRREAEQRRLDEEARKQAAEEARANGEKLLAKQIESGKVAVVSETVVATPVKIQGFTTTDTWDVAVVSPMILLRSIIQGKYPVAWVYFDLKAMSDAVKRASGTLNIEGCAIRKVVSGRRTR